MVFQDPYASLNPRRRIGRQISDGIRLAAERDGGSDVTPQSLLERVGLASDLVDRYPHEFSGGQRQRIAIARALAGPRCSSATSPSRPWTPRRRPRSPV